jgi:hypothetical protein
MMMQECGAPLGYTSPDSREIADPATHRANIQDENNCVDFVERPQMLEHFHGWDDVCSSARQVVLI